jgi:hypothetical protein
MANWKRSLAWLAATWMLSVGTVWMTRWAGGIDDGTMVNAMVQMSFAQRGTPPSDEQAAAAAAMMTPMVRAYPIVIPINITLWLLALTTVFFIACKALEESPSWKTVFEATAFAAACQAAATLLLTGMAVLSAPPTAGELLRGTFVVSNAAGLLSEETPLLLTVLTRRLDVLTIIFLLVLGVTLAERLPAKASRGALAGIIAGCWALWIAGSLMVAMVMPSMVR